MELEVAIRWDSRRYVHVASEVVGCASGHLASLLVFAFSFVPLSFLVLCHFGLLDLRIA